MKTFIKETIEIWRIRKHWPTHFKYRLLSLALAIISVIVSVIAIVITAISKTN